MLEKLGNHEKKKRTDHPTSTCLFQSTSNKSKNPSCFSISQHVLAILNQNSSESFHNIPKIKPLLVSVCLAFCHGDDTEMSHKCNAGQCFTPKAQSTDGLQVLKLPQFRRCVPFTKEWQIFILTVEENTSVCTQTTTNSRHKVSSNTSMIRVS